MIPTALAEIRYGYGVRPGTQGARQGDDLLAQLAPGFAPVAPLSGLEHRMAEVGAFNKLRAAVRKGEVAGAALDEMRMKRRQARLDDFRDLLLRPLLSPAGFRERLVAFWANHFTVAANQPQRAAVYPAYVDDAIRPHLSGRFADMLFAVVTHPAMLHYLDQFTSFGPNSRIGQRQGRGLNENLAREMLELHTLGVEGAYTQADVRQLAELLTGLRLTEHGFEFHPNAAEPGAETVLGRRFGGHGRARLSDIRAVAEHLATHPDTARHIARKLVVHFVSDDPDPGLIERLAAAYRAGGGALMPVYEALLGDDRAWQADLQKVKPPVDYMISAARALGFDDPGALDEKALIGRLRNPMIAMGQNPGHPPGPDGWPEEAAAWITPPLLAARIEWTVAMARELGADHDPRDLLEAVLGALASDDLRFAAQAAESKWEGVALILVSPEFNRR